MNYTHILGRVFGVPLAIHEPKLEQILAGLGPRLLGLKPRAFYDDDDRPRRPPPKPYQVDGAGVARLPVLGVLVQRAGQVDPLSTPLRSYEQLQADLGMALDDRAVRAVVLDIDSPGGEAVGVMELAGTIHAMRGRKPIIAVANSAAFSAAYAIASAADQVFLPPTGAVGSIGIVAVHVNQAGADAKAGLQFEFLHAGAKKVDGHSHGPLSDTARADITADIQALYGLFTSHVATVRAIPEAAVRATEAGIYRGQEAIKAGLADAIGTVDQAVAHAARLAATSRRGGTTGPGSHRMTDEELAAYKAEQEKARLQAAEEAEKKGRADAAAEAAKIVELCNLAGRPQDAAGHIAASRTAGEVSEALLRARAAAPPQTTTDPAHGVHGAGAEPPANPNDPHGWEASIKRVCGNVRA